jgi:drug/metabolite transporter (DMT)-like permease
MRIDSIDRSAGQRQAFGQLALVVVLFGVAWPVMKVGLEDGATPLWFATARAGLSAAASFALVLALGRWRLPGRQDLPIILSVGIFQITCFFALSNLGLRFVSAGRSAVLAYTTSLWIVPLAALAGERVGARRLIGVVVGLGGVAVLLDPLSQGLSREVLLGDGCLLLAALAWALAIVHARRHVWRLSPLQVLPWQMLLATILLGGLALAAEPGGGLPPRWPVALSLAYLGIIAGPIASSSAMSVARALPTVVSSIGFLGVPVVGIVLSTLWLGEPVSWPLATGALLVLLGLGLVALSGGRR